MKNVNIEEVAKKYTEGATLKELANEYGCSIPTVSRALHKHGTPVRSKGRRKKEVEKVTAKEAIASVSDTPTNPEGARIPDMTKGAGSEEPKHRILSHI